MDFFLAIAAYWAVILFFSFLVSFPFRLVSETLGKAVQWLMMVIMILYSIFYYVFHSLKEFFVLLFTFFKVVFCG